MQKNTPSQGLIPSGLSTFFLIVDSSARIIDISGHEQLPFGLSRQQLLAEGFSCVISEPAAPQLYACLQNISGSLPASFEHILHINHTDYHVLFELYHVSIQEQDYCLIQFRDNTQAISNSNIIDRLGRILDASWEEVFVFEAKSLHFIQVSQGAQHNLGFSMQEMRELTPVDIKPQYSEAQFREMLTPLLQGEVNTLEINTIHRRKDGSDYIVEIRLQYAQNENPPVFVALVKDITEQQQIQRRLQESEQRLSLHVQQTPLGVIDWNLDFEVMSWNPAAERIFGFSREEAMGRHASELVIQPASKEHVDKIWQALLHQKDGLQSTNENITKDGRDIMCEWYNTPLVDEDGSIVGVSSLVQDITERTQAENKLTYQASHDVLTGLANRRKFERQLHICLKSAREQKQEHALLYLDLDQFKVVNDTCGHVAGDELLKQISVLMGTHLRVADTFSRLGGDEFGVLLVKCPGKNARIVADNLRQTVKDFRFVWQARTFDLSVSIGVATIDEHSESVESLLSAADVACYTAKENGRNRIHVYVAHDKELAQRHGEMHRVSDISRAIEEDRLCLYAQEIMPLKRVKTTASNFEILVRMIAEDKKLLLPGAFLPAAERYNLMPEIDKWVINRAFLYLRDGMPINGWTEKSSLMINLSGHSLNSTELLEYVENKLDEYQINATQICFEITETIAVANLTNTVKLIHVLKERGCQFALDDFGSGVSSFSYLKNLPVDFLKIDGEFVKDMTDDSIDYAMVETINKIARLMDKKTIAEYVETDQIKASLKKIGVDYVQGFGIGKPFPVDSE